VEVFQQAGAQGADGFGEGSFGFWGHGDGNVLKAAGLLPEKLA
jgi:hypothetical protein